MDEDTLDKLLNNGWKKIIALKPKNALPGSSTFAQLRLPEWNTFATGFLTGLLAASAATFACISHRRLLTQQKHIINGYPVL
ncbi:hypothetical protein M422DRAFT_268211 [Sphaerobolus stellatus SS14]|uniref:Uncharacterized protein n=1 Tax=Sphaerobolus stellatus (strain SS14) TaxID=990650 RepID=A0A0C9TKN4_SPHS4|nr:hypothetical protein M422DRAFT_268211 [Sphaerobolus stellatus SS14]